MMLMDASCPSNRLAAETKRILAADLTLRSMGWATPVRRSTSAVSAMIRAPVLTLAPLRSGVLCGGGPAASPDTGGDARAASLAMRISEGCRLVDACASVHCLPGRRGAND